MRVEKKRRTAASLLPRRPKKAGGWGAFAHACARGWATRSHLTPSQAQKYRWQCHRAGWRGEEGRWRRGGAWRRREKADQGARHAVFPLGGAEAKAKRSPPPEQRAGGPCHHARWSMRLMVITWWVGVGVVRAWSLLVCVGCAPCGGISHHPLCVNRFWGHSLTFFFFLRCVSFLVLPPSRTRHPLRWAPRSTLHTHARALPPLPPPYTRVERERRWEPSACSLFFSRPRQCRRSRLRVAPCRGYVSLSEEMRPPYHPLACSVGLCMPRGIEY